MRITLEEIVKRLNSMVAADSDAMLRLIKQRVPCNQALADHPTCQVFEDDDGNFTVGLLGVINGILGKDREGWGPLSAVLDDNETTLHLFKETPEYGGDK